MALSLMVFSQRTYACHYSNAFAAPPSAAFNCTTCMVDVSFTTEVQGGLADTESLTLDFNAGTITNVVVTDAGTGTTGDANAGTTFDSCSGTGHDVSYTGSSASFSSNAPILNDLCAGGGANGASVDLQLVISFDPNQPLPTSVGTTGLEGGTGPGTGCDETGTFTLPDLSLDLQADIALDGTGTTDAHCGNSDGSIQVTEASGNGCAPYTYEISAGPQTRPTQTGTQFCDLPSGTYTVQVTDNCGASATVDMTIEEDDPPTVTTTGVAACAGALAEVTATCVPPAVDNDAAPTSTTIYWYSDAAATTQIGTGSPFDAAGFTTVYAVCEEIYNTSCSGADVVCRSPAVATSVAVYPTMTVELVPIKCNGDPDGDNNPVGDVDEYTYEVVVSLDGPLPLAGTIDLSGPITGSITTNTTDLVFTFDGPAPIPTTTAGTLTATITDANALGCSATYEVVDVGECSCVQYACADATMYDAPDVTFANTGNTDYTQTYILIDGGNIVAVDANSTFDLSAQTVGTACTVAGVEYANDGVSDAFFAGATTLDELLNASDVDPCICLDVSFKCCYIYKEPDPVVTPVDKILVCDADAISQVLTEVTDPLATAGAYSFDWAVDNTSIGDPALAASTDGDATNGGSVASGSPIAFTADGGAAGGTGNEATITVTPFYLADGPNTYDPPMIDYCQGADITFTVCVASQMTIAQSSTGCNQNEFAVTVAGGYPDLAGTGANPASEYSFTIDGVAATPAIGTVTDGGVFTFTNQTPGCHTIAVNDDLGTGCGPEETTAEVYDPFNIEFTYSCDANQIVVNSITGGQDPAVTWCAGSVPQYTVTIAGSTEGSQTITTALEFPMTFTGLAEGTYDVVVADAIGCGATFQAEAYEPIALQSTGERCDLNNQISINVTGGQPDHPGTTDIITATNGTGSGINTGDNYGLGNYTITIDGGLGVGTLIGTSTVPADGSIVTNLDDAGNLLPCGSHDIHFTYDLYDDDGTDTGIDCEEIIRVDIYDLVTADLSTPACGSINIDNVSGGFDPNCPNGYDNPTPGYTVTIEGPLAGTGIPGVPSALYTHSTSPSASTSFSFTPGDASGVPVNGLPGGVYEIVIIDGLSDGNCPFVDEIEIVGCCPASTDANTDYQLCGMNQPSAQPGPNEDLPSVTPVFGDLPALEINSPNTNLNIDADTDVALNTDDAGSGADAGGDGVDWFLGPDPLTDAPYTDAAMVSASECDPAQYTIYAFLRCDGDHDGAFAPGQTGTNPGAEVGYDPMGTDSYIPAGQVTVTVWPEIAIPDIWYPNDPVECQVNLLNPCPDVYELEVTDEDGNNYFADNSGGLFLDPYGSGYTYDGISTPLPGTIGDLTLTITNPAAIDAFTNGVVDPDDPDNITCSVVEFERGYVCCLAEAGVIDSEFGCPPEIDPATGDQIGDGDPVTFPVLDDFMGDVGTLQLPNYQTYVIVADASGTIYDVILVAETDGTGTLVNDIRPFSIPYADFANYNGYGVDYYFYNYNVFLSNPPEAACLPVGITVPSPPAVNEVVGAATTIAEAMACTSPFEGCFDFSDYTVTYMPNALSQECNVQTYEGEQGGTSPFHYNKREMCISGGTPPYTYEWDEIGYVRPAIIYQRLDSAILRVEYDDNAYWSVTITDRNGCTDDIWEFTNDNNGTNDGDNPVLDIETADITHDNCITRTIGEGKICLEANGGSQNGDTPDFMYDWTGPFTWNGGQPMSGMGMNCIENLPYGWYAVTVTETATAGTGESVAMGDVTEGWYWIQCQRPSGRGKLDLSTNSLTAYPNPFTDATTIEFGLTKDVHVNVALFGLTGQKIVDIYTGEVDAQTAYEIPFEAGHLPVGVYFINMTTEDGETVNHKLIISK